jgi:hypothetical protein
MARSFRLTTATPLALALAALASCSQGGGAGGPAPDDDPRGVNERVREIVQRFSYGDAGPYQGPAGDGDAFGGEASGGPFEGADSPGLIGPPSAAAGAYERSSPCDAYCTFAAGCLGVPVPASCTASCNAAVAEVVRPFGGNCAEPLCSSARAALGSATTTTGKTSPTSQSASKRSRAARRPSRTSRSASTGPTSTSAISSTTTTTTTTTTTRPTTTAAPAEAGLRPGSSCGAWPKCSPAGARP